MFLIDRFEVEKRVRIMRREFEKFRISEELRGYNWDSPPVEPNSSGIYLSLSDFYGTCPAMRDIYLKYVEGIKPALNTFMLRGLAYHEVIKEALIRIKGTIYNGVMNGIELMEKLQKVDIPAKVCERLNVEAKVECEKLFKYIILQCAAEIDRILSKFPYIDVDSLINKALPPVVERRIDGSFIGLSNNLSIDLFTPYNVIADLKSGEERERNLLILTGYALALESDEMTDVNFGFLIYLRIKNTIQFKIRHSLISDELRRNFLELRDEIFEVIESGVDPGKSTNCSKYCPYFGVCNEAGD